MCLRLATLVPEWLRMGVWVHVWGTSLGMTIDMGTGNKMYWYKMGRTERTGKPQSCKQSQ